MTGDNPERDLQVEMIECGGSGGSIRFEWLHSDTSGSKSEGCTDDEVKFDLGLALILRTALQKCSATKKLARLPGKRKRKGKKMLKAERRARSLARYAVKAAFRSLAENRLLASLN